MPCTNNLREIILALHEYHDDYGSLPPAFTVGQNGEPLHSWRTLLLPYLQQEELYNQIRLHEPWNSQHNKRFAELPLSIFCCPTAKSGLSYLAITTDGAVFNGPNACSFQEMLDGTSNTIALIEVSPLSKSWMEPVDFDERELAKKIQSPHLGGTQAAYVDGSVRFLQATIREQTLRALLTHSGGEQVRDEDW
jgi:prepilin-type processing-associated H-X9-DG protein